MAIEHEHVVTHGYLAPNLKRCAKRRSSPCFSRVMLVDCFTQAVLHNVCVDLCSAEVSVTEHKLHASEICASFQQMRGERVPHNVRTQPSVDPGGFSMHTQELPKTLPC